MSDSTKVFFATIGIILTIVICTVTIVFLVAKEKFDLGIVLLTAFICQIPTEIFLLKIFDAEEKSKQEGKEVENT